jgi:hypothetical protein
MSGKIATAVAAFAAVSMLGLGQESPTPKLKGYFTHIPWKDGTNEVAAEQAAAGTTIPMFNYSVRAGKDGAVHTGTMVGTSPFAATLHGSTIPAVIVPLRISIGTAIYDPTMANPCDSSVSAVNRLHSSPLITSSNLTFNGVSVGNHQFIDGFRRAEFWTKVAGSAAYTNPLSPVTTAPVQVVVAGSHGINFSSGCSRLGIVSINWLNTKLLTIMSNLTAQGVVGPTKVVIFLVDNVVQSGDDPPDLSNCCILGYHSATGSPVQTYLITDWDTSGEFGSAAEDGSVSAHEIGEWMDDPLGNNLVAAWGNIGQVGGCQGNLEVGDPLTGTLMPAITLGGHAYHMQELAFFSWFFSGQHGASLGAGGAYSAHATFKGPSKACPPGGTF